MERMVNPLHEKIREAFADRVDDLDEFGLSPEVEDVAHESYDGFIPFTNGGLSVMVMNDLRSAWGSGETFAEEAQDDIEKAIDYSLGFAMDSFIDDSMDKLKAIYGTDDKDKLKEIVSYHDLYDRDESTLAEQLSEYENDSMSEGGEFWMVLRAFYFAADNARNNTGEDEIYFHAGVNTDYSYGRDKGLIITFDKNVKVSELTEESLEEIVSEMVSSIHA